MDDRRFILDTDIGPDCDDAAALALAVRYARESGARLLGAMHCTSSPWGVGAIRAILAYHMAPEVAVGTLKDEGFLSGPSLETYNRVLAMGVDAPLREAQDAQPLYRELLFGQPDQSVDVIGIGPMRNLGKLIADADGMELVRRKVRRLTLMAGDFSPDCQRAEYNVAMDVPSARRVAERWPGEVVWCGFEVGRDVIALKEPNPLPEDDPVREAYRLHTGGAGRSSWDLCTVQWAMQPECGFYAVSGPGTVRIDERGVTRWHEAPGGRHRVLKLAAPAEAVADSFARTLTEN